MLIEPQVFGDERGSFAIFNHVQKHSSRSENNGLRDLYHQIQPQGKLHRVAKSEALDVKVDIHKSSATFEAWVGKTLFAENKISFGYLKNLLMGFFHSLRLKSFRRKQRITMPLHIKMYLMNQ